MRLPNSQSPSTLQKEPGTCHVVWNSLNVTVHCNQHSHPPPFWSMDSEIPSGSTHQTETCKTQHADNSVSLYVRKNETKAVRKNENKTEKCGSKKYRQNQAEGEMLLSLTSVIHQRVGAEGSSFRVLVSLRPGSSALMLFPVTEMEKIVRTIKKLE